MPERRDADNCGIVILVPWWVWSALAVLVYGALHYYAVAAVPTAGGWERMGQTIGRQAAKGLAMIGQYVAPLPVLGCAVASIFGRRKRAALLRNVASSTSSEALRSMSWQDFELLVGEAFRRRGFSVAETGGGGADGGIDLRLKKGSETFLVQCKQWRAYKVSVHVVRELFGVMAAQGATGGFVVTSGVFTAAAQAFARGRNIELLDGPALGAMIEEVHPVRAVVTPTGVETGRPAPIEAALSVGAPPCPLCGRPMVPRTARRGANAGGAFWGCPAYPGCRGTRPID